MWRPSIEIAQRGGVRHPRWLTLRSALGANALLGVTLFAAALGANSRAPRIVPWVPSTAARVVSQDVVAEHEALSFRCDKARCQVKATYRVRAGSDQQVELRFVVPIKAPVTARFGTANGAVTVAGAPAVRASEVLAKIPLNYPDKDRPPMYEATVIGPLSAGLNELSFEYVQPLGGEESLRKGTLSQSFNYGLWPLREWKRAQGFTLDFTATLERSAPSLWQRWFGTVREMNCWFGDRQTMAPPKLPLRRTQRRDVLWLEARVPLPAIPETVGCLIADDLDVDDE
jgi:hypothetical protein